MTDAGTERIEGTSKTYSLRLSCHGTSDGRGSERTRTNSKTSPRLTFGRTKVTDAGLKELKGLKNLTTLSPWGRKVTDAGLKELKDLKNLDHA